MPNKKSDFTKQNRITFQIEKKYFFYLLFLAIKPLDFYIKNIYKEVCMIVLSVCELFWFEVCLETAISCLLTNLSK